MITNFLSDRDAGSACIETRRLQTRLLKIIAGLGIVVILLMWASQSWLLKYANPIDRVAYPSLIVLLLGSILILCFWRQGYPIAASCSVGGFAVYCAIYLQAIIYGYEPIREHCNLPELAQCFPLVYIAAFIFLQRRQSVLVSISVYLSLFLPTLLKFAIGLTFTQNDSTLPILVQMICSHPLYIAVLLWINIIQKSLNQATTQLNSMKVIANFDYLTGIYNRRAINEILQEALTKANVTDTRIAAILLDIDNFKRINDIYGHDVGDQVLIAFSNVLKKYTDTKNSLGRWGGEEFLIVQTGATLLDATQLAQNLCTFISSQSDLPVERVTASFGIALSQPHDTIESLTKRADIALYQAKKQGRNRVEVVA
jgi:diguanylate cyclase (GGDEF)-like protein